jgi:hypothetical protein
MLVLCLLRAGHLLYYICYGNNCKPEILPFGLLHFFIYDFTSCHYNICLQCAQTLWRCVSERSWFLFGSAAWIFLDLRLWSLLWSLFCYLLGDLLRWSLFCLFCVSSLCVRLSAAPQIGCLHLGKKTLSPTVLLPIAAVSNNLVA